jgi:hypothetical protein
MPGKGPISMYQAPSTICANSDRHSPAEAAPSMATALDWYVSWFIIHSKEKPVAWVEQAVHGVPASRPGVP